MTSDHLTPSTIRPAVAVFGAAGHTGRFVVSELLQRGFRPIAIGRKETAETRAAAVDDPASIDRALAGAIAVINCAGPFLDTAEPIAAGAIRACIPYLDFTAEQASALAIFERFDGAAREAGVALVPAMGFFGGLADLLATSAMGDWTSADAIDVRIALDSWLPTAGTRLTGQRNTVPRLVIAGGQLAPLPLPAAESAWTFPQPFGLQDIVELPFSETILISSHLRVGELHTWLNLAPLRDLREASTPSPTPADASGRSAQQFLVQATVRKAAATRRATASGRDIYAVTAPLVVEALQRIVTGEVARSGVLAPGEVFEAASFLRALSPEHLTVDID